MTTFSTTTTLTVTPDKQPGTLYLRLADGSPEGATLRHLSADQSRKVLEALQNKTNYSSEGLYLTDTQPIGTVIVNIDGMYVNASRDELLKTVSDAIGKAVGINIVNSLVRLSFGIATWEARVPMARTFLASLTTKLTGVQLFDACSWRPLVIQGYDYDNDLARVTLRYDGKEYTVPVEPFKTALREYLHNH